MLQKCQEIVDKLALFSSNEEKDDVSTGDLKYLLVCERSFVCCLFAPNSIACSIGMTSLVSRLPVFRLSLYKLSR